MIFGYSTDTCPTRVNTLVTVEFAWVKYATLIETVYLIRTLFFKYETWKTIYETPMYLSSQMNKS